MNDFGRLLEKRNPAAAALCSWTHDRSRADDLVQDTLVRAIANQQRWQRNTDLRGWLFTIMHNRNVNVVRRRVREGIAVALDGASLFLTVRSDQIQGHCTILIAPLRKFPSSGVRRFC